MTKEMRVYLMDVVIPLGTSTISSAISGGLTSGLPGVLFGVCACAALVLTTRLLLEPLVRRKRKKLNITL